MSKTTKMAAAVVAAKNHLDLLPQVLVHGGFLSFLDVMDMMKMYRTSKNWKKQCGQDRFPRRAFHSFTDYLIPFEHQLKVARRFQEFIGVEDKQCVVFDAASSSSSSSASISIIPPLKLTPIPVVMVMIPSTTPEEEEEEEEEKKKNVSKRYISPAEQLAIKTGNIRITRDGIPWALDVVSQRVATISGEIPEKKPVASIGSSSSSSDIEFSSSIGRSGSKNEEEEEVAWVQVHELKNPATRPLCSQDGKKKMPKSPLRHQRLYPLGPFEFEYAHPFIAYLKFTPSGIRTLIIMNVVVVVKEEKETEEWGEWTIPDEANLYLCTSTGRALVYKPPNLFLYNVMAPRTVKKWRTAVGQEIAISGSHRKSSNNKFMLLWPSDLPPPPLPPLLVPNDRLECRRFFEIPDFEQETHQRHEIVPQQKGPFASYLNPRRELGNYYHIPRICLVRKKPALWLTTSSDEPTTVRAWSLESGELVWRRDYRLSYKSSLINIRDLHVDDSLINNIRDLHVDDSAWARSDYFILECENTPAYDPPGYIKRLLVSTRKGGDLVKTAPLLGVMIHSFSLDSLLIGQYQHYDLAIYNLVTRQYFVLSEYTAIHALNRGLMLAATTHHPNDSRSFYLVIF